MSNIKKAYVEIIDLLEANEDKKVKTILDQVKALASAKGKTASGENVIRDTDGNPVAIFDYYFKRYMPLVGDKQVEFGAKKGTATGLNVMCKQGVSHWTKQQRVADQASKSLLARVASGEIAPTDILIEQERIEAERKAIAETDLGFATKEEVLAYLADNGVSISA